MEHLRNYWLPYLLIALTVTVIGIVAMIYNDFENECDRRGGTIEERFEYMQTTYISDGKGGLTPIITPIYSYHCWVDEKEVMTG